MSQNIQFGSEAKGSELLLMRLLNDHSQIETAKPGTGEYTDRDDAEFKSKIIGDIAVNAQDDGTYQLQFTVAAFGIAIFNLIESYKNVTTAGEKEDFVAWHGQSWDAGNSGSSDDLLFACIHGPLDPDTAKRIIYAMPCNIVIANTGGHTLQANTSIQVQVTLQQVKAKQDITFHTGTGSPTVLDPNFVDIASEDSDIIVAEDSLKYHYPVTDAS